MTDSEYDPAKRIASPPGSARPLRKIEAEFAIPVYLSIEQERQLHNLLDDITHALCNQPEGGTHWVMSYGSKPSYSQADLRFLGRPVDPNAPPSGEPTYDDEIFYFETHARAFLSTGERKAILSEREKREKG